MCVPDVEIVNPFFIWRGFQHNLDINQSTGIDLPGRTLMADGAQLLARFLAVPGVSGRIRRLDLRSVSGLELISSVAIQQFLVRVVQNIIFFTEFSERCKGRKGFRFITLKKACNMICGKGRVRTQDLDDTRRSALTPLYVYLL